MFLGRKINRPKWPDFDPNCPDETPLDSPDEIPADAVTELRTYDNTLSFWKCSDESDGELNDLVLALATANTDRIDKIDCVWVREESIIAAGIPIESTSGTTYVADLRPKHRDLAELNFVRLGTVCDAIHTSIRADGYRRFSKSQVTKLIKSAVDDGRLSLNDLPGDIRAKIATAK